MAETAGREETAETAETAENSTRRDECAGGGGGGRGRGDERPRLENPGRCER